MTDIKSRPIGEIFHDRGVRLQVIENKSSICAGCYYDSKYLECKVRDESDAGSCYAPFRRDKKNVIFKQIKP